MSSKDRRGWTHERCTHCVERGAGPDRGKHLGRNVNGYLHCLRCGYSKSNKGIRSPSRGTNVDSRTSSSSSFPSSIARERIPLLINALDTSDRGTHFAKYLSKLWPWKLSIEEIDPYVERYTPDSVVFRLQSIDGRRGSFERYFGRVKKCKQSGELGWCYPGQPEPFGSSVILVEGIADAIAASSLQHTGVALMGTGNAKLAPKMLPLLRARITLLLDGDDTGRRATLNLGRTLLKLRRPFSMATCPEGTDPASLGRNGVLKVLESARRVDSLRSLLNE